MKTDLLDRRILELLATNCRLSDSVIGRAVKLSKDAVTYRVRKLVDAGILQRRMLLLDVRRLGFTCYHLLLRLDAPKEARDRYIRAMAKHPASMWINSFVGRFDVQLILHASNAFHFELIRQEIFALCDHSVRDYTLLAHLWDYEFTNLIPEIELGTPFERADDGSFANVLARRSNANGPAFERFELAPRDARLLRLLADDPSRSLTNIAEELSTDRVTVRRHILELIRRKVITSFAGVVDQHHFGRTTYYLLVRVAPSAPRQTLRKPYKRLKNVFYAGAMVGDFDMILYLNAASPQELNLSIDVFRSELEGKILGYELLVQDAVHHWRHATETVLGMH